MEVGDFEFQSEMEKTWKAFWRLRRSLLSKRGSPRERLRLMSIAVGGVFLRGCETWRPTIARLRELVSFERRLGRL
eukprot:8633843-Alexandrium_andersonii.AAC.1